MPFYTSSILVTVIFFVGKSVKCYKIVWNLWQLQSQRKTHANHWRIEDHFASTLVRQGNPEMHGKVQWISTYGLCQIFLVQGKFWKKSIFENQCCQFCNFFQIDPIMDANYKPSLEDILRSRKRTKGFSDIKFVISVSIKIAIFSFFFKKKLVLISTCKISGFDHQSHWCGRAKNWAEKMAGILWQH